MKRSLAAVITALLIAMAPTSPAHGATNARKAGPSQSQCAKAHAHPNRAKAKSCRRHGWVVSRLLVVTPGRHHIAWFKPGRTCRNAEASDSLDKGCVFPESDPDHRPGWMTANRRTGMLTIHYLR